MGDDMTDNDDEITIKHIIPVELTEKELHVFGSGFLRREILTREELERKYGTTFHLSTKARVAAENL